MRAPRTSALRRTATVAAGLALTTALAACGQTGGGGSAEDFPSKTVEFMVPAAAGGGWDSTAREMQKVIEKDDVIKQPVEVFNVEGGGGATGLAQLQKDQGDPHNLMMTGLVMIGALRQANSPVSLDDTTPIATLTAEAEAFVVPKSSPFTSIKDVVDASKMKYVGYSGGGEATAGILSGDVEVGVSGVSEFEGQIESGDMRLLAISTADTQDVAGQPAPTLKDAGYDVDFSNWRAVVAAPDLSDEQKQAVTDMIDKMHATPEWKDVLERNGWADFYKTGDEAQQYIDDETARVGDLYKDLGL
jgi:putative tricarboxylic transport membrane protein